MRSFELTGRKGAAAAAAVGALALFAAGCANPRAEAATAQALSDAANEIGGLRSEVSDLQAQLDSLRTAVAKQDTIIARIAEVSHIPIK